MASWNELLEAFAGQPDDDARNEFLKQSVTDSLAEVGRLRGDRHVLYYGSAFLQRPRLPGEHVSLTHEDLNGFMSCIYQMDWSRGLTLMLHTPGGDPNAATAIVDYLRQKFTELEVIVPALAMSAGTMMALASDRIVMGRQSQLGPIDPQWVGGGRPMSARAVVEQFERARAEILKDNSAAHVWAPILGQVGPALLQESQNALDFSELTVAGWLTRWMKSGDADPAAAGTAIAKHFNDATTHKSHGRRINRKEASDNGVVVEELEADGALQEAVLTAYHLTTILFEQSLTSKLLWSDKGRTWMKNFQAA
jgi:hypothetical protein